VWKKRKEEGVTQIITIYNTVQFILNHG